MHTVFIEGNYAGGKQSKNLINKSNNIKTLYLIAQNL